MTKIEEVMGKINDTIEFANKKLASIVKRGFPFSYEEVELKAETDRAGIYIRSGKTPVCAVRRAGTPEAVVETVKSEIWALVDATRAAVERRSEVKAEAEALADDAAKYDRAVKALEDSGNDPSMLGGVNPEAAQAVVKAVGRAVLKANRGLFMVVGNAIPLSEAKLYVEGYNNGIVVLAGKKPCLVTRFPKILNNKGVERTCAFIEADIEAINASRRAYFAKLRKLFDAEEALRAESDRIAAVM